MSVLPCASGNSAVTDGDLTSRNDAWPAPAKLNLFLHVTGRRSDGYHTLQTAFLFLDHGDQMYFTVRDDGLISRRGDMPGVAADDDLAVRAARLLQTAAGCGVGADITVHKRLPIGGGVGGGSSNAATTLVALNRLWDAGLDEDALAELGLRLGADVPVFVRGRSAWAEGVGEVLTPIDFPPAWYVVLIPPCTVSTAEIFGAPELTRNTPPLRISAFRFGGGRNDCQPVVRERYPQVAQAIDALAEFGDSRMTGTGACVFAPFADEAHAAAALARCRAAGWTGFMARGRNESPLLDRLAGEARQASAK